MNGEPTVLITGAAGALGGATTDAFLGAGFAVLGVDRAEHDPGWVSARPSYTPLQLDLEHSGAGEVLADAIAGQQLSHVVTIAGGALPGEPESTEDPLHAEVELFRASVEANLTTQYRTIHAVAPALGASPGDRSITLCSSFNALSAQGMPGYSAAKAGLLGMMYALVDPFGRQGIRVNVLAPGTVRTPRTERLWAHVEGHFERLERSTALGRLATPADIGRSSLALATQLTHVTGQVLVVDGGQTVVHR